MSTLLLFQRYLTTRYLGEGAARETPTPNKPVAFCLRATFREGDLPGLANQSCALLPGALIAFPMNYFVTRARLSSIRVHPNSFPIILCPLAIVFRETYHVHKSIDSEFASFAGGHEFVLNRFQSEVYRITPL